MPSLCVSIVVYHPDLPLLAEVLAHLHAAVLRAGLPGNIETVVINNDAADPVAERLPAQPGVTALAPTLALRIINSGGNIGYGAANNLAIRASNADFHLVLNPDALLAEDFLHEALAWMAAHPDTGLIVPRVSGFDGELHYLNKRHPSLFDLYLRAFVPLRWLPAPLRQRVQARRHWFEMREHDYNQPLSPVPFPTGCCMFLRGPLLRALNGFDEDFFMYLEDADLGRRVNRVATSVYLPQCQVRHQWARGSHRVWRLRWATIVSAFTYWRKWGGLWRGSADAVGSTHQEPR